MRVGVVVVSATRLPLAAVRLDAAAADDGGHVPGALLVRLAQRVEGRHCGWHDQTRSERKEFNRN